MRAERTAAQADLQQFHFIQTVVFEILFIQAVISMEGDFVGIDVGGDVAKSLRTVRVAGGGSKQFKLDRTEHEE